MIFTGWVVAGSLLKGELHSAMSIARKDVQFVEERQSEIVAGLVA